MATTVARLACDEPQARRLAAVLGESLDAEGAVCAAFADARGHWQFGIYFRDAPDEAAIRALVAVAADTAAADALVFAVIADADWVAQSLAGLAPVRAGRFVVHGAHDRARVPVNAVAIEIEAAGAFGTGHHGTTHGCLLALDALAKRARLKRVLDLGTGSGILAVAAAKVLRTRVVASDIDAGAVAAARTNARVNRVAPWISALHAAGTRSPTITASAPYDLILANILLEPLMRLAVPLARLSRPGARLVLSGLLSAQANAALTIYGAQGYVLTRRIARDGWTTLTLEKRNRPGRARPERPRR
jgi:ribosomal protein L11 methyltransferase